MLLLMVLMVRAWVHAVTQGFDAWLPWDTNPLYALLHEACYCNGGASEWAAQRVRDGSFSEHFDAALAAANGRQVLFTGENEDCQISMRCLSLIAGENQASACSHVKDGHGIAAKIAHVICFSTDSDAVHAALLEKLARRLPYATPVRIGASHAHTLLEGAQSGNKGCCCRRDGVPLDV